MQSKVDEETEGRKFLDNGVAARNASTWNQFKNVKHDNANQQINICGVDSMISNAASKRI
jgi:hypothetical protein